MDKLFLTDAFRKVFKIKYISIDNSIFRLHYRGTFPLFVTFSILVTGTQFFGDPIRCIQRDDVPERVINTYCWVESTFTLPKALTKVVGDEVVYPGVEQYKNGDDVIEHAYYQWVCFMLFLQGLMFYITRVMWKSWEGGRVRSLIMELDRPILKEEVTKEKCEALSGCLVDNFRRHNGYAFRFFLCEVLNFIHVICQIFLTDVFLGYEFTTYGSRVIQFTEMNQEDRFDPMIRVFPRITKCTFHKFGSAGSVQLHDALCLLPLNIVNEKIYVFLWFWLVILAILSGLMVCYRILVMGWPNIRLFLLYNRNRIADKDDMDKIVRAGNYGDWFLLYLLSNNMHSLHFRQLIKLLAGEVSSSPRFKRFAPKNIDFPSKDTEESKPLKKSKDDISKGDSSFV